MNKNKLNRYTIFLLQIIAYTSTIPMIIYATQWQWII
jgi:hypothetical protein